MSTALPSAQTYGIENLLTYEQAAAIVGGNATPRFIKNEIKRGKLVGTDLGHRVKRVAPRDLNAYMLGARTLENRRH